MSIKYKDQIGNQSLMDYLEIDDALEMEKRRVAEEKIVELGDYNIASYLFPEEEDE